MKIVRYYNQSSDDGGGSEHGGVFDAIKNMQKEGGVNTSTTAPPAVPPTPATPATPSVPATPATTPKKDDTAAPAAQKIVKDPAFIRKEGEQKPGETPAAQPGQKTDEPAAATPAPTEQMFSRMSELTEGTIKSEEDFVELIEHYNELRQLQEEGFKPKFANERARKAYELLTASKPGKEIEDAQRTMRALSLQGKEANLTEKDWLFNAYLLNPDNADFSESEARQYFEQEYAEKYAQAEGEEPNLLKKRDLQVAVKKAKESIAQLQSDYLKPEADNQQAEADRLREISESVGNAIADFEGLRMAFSDKPEENEFLNIHVTDKKELQDLQRYTVNPNNFWNELVDQYKGPNGSFDYQGWALKLYQMVHHEKISKLSYAHGVEMGKLQRLKEDVNSTTAADIAKNTLPAGGGAQQPKSFMDAWDKAQSGK